MATLLSRRDALLKKVAEALGLPAKPSNFATLEQDVLDRLIELSNVEKMAFELATTNDSLVQQLRERDSQLRAVRRELHSLVPNGYTDPDA